MLPCEFCEELFPPEDLILHQVGHVTLWRCEWIMFGLFASDCLMASFSCDLGITVAINIVD